MYLCVCVCSLDLLFSLIGVGSFLFLYIFHARFCVNFHLLTLSQWNFSERPEKNSSPVAVVWHGMVGHGMVGGARLCL